MIKRRMISLDIIKSNRYQEMPISSKYLYIELLVRADDAGIIDDSYSIMRMLGASTDDLKLLIVKGYLIVVEDGLYVVSDWPIHNDTTKRWFKRGKCTLYQDIFAKLNWTPDTRYDYQPNIVICSNMTDTDNDNHKILDAKSEILEPKNIIKQKTGDDVIKEMDQIIALLGQYGIYQTSKKGRQIAESCSLSKVIAGIKYAKDNMPEACNNIPGWIVKCIEMEQHTLEICPNCHGQGKKQTISPDPNKNDGSVISYSSDCPICKGKGFIKK